VSKFDNACTLPARRGEDTAALPPGRTGLAGQADGTLALNPMKGALAILGLIVVGCPLLFLFVKPGPPPPPARIVIADVTQPTNILMVGDGSQPSTLELKVTGRIDGVAKLTVSSVNFTNRYSGMGRLDWFGPDVQFRGGQDWFETNAVLNYEPSNVKTGHLTVEFKFR
jgi:hypothetical protein